MYTYCTHNIYAYIHIYDVIKCNLPARGGTSYLSTSARRYQCVRKQMEYESTWIFRQNYAKQKTFKRSPRPAETAEQSVIEWLDKRCRPTSSNLPGYHAVGLAVESKVSTWHCFDIFLNVAKNLGSLLTCKWHSGSSTTLHLMKAEVNSECDLQILQY